MKIVRDNKGFELTEKEMQQAYKGVINMENGTLWSPSDDKPRPDDEELEFIFDLDNWF